MRAGKNKLHEYLVEEIIQAVKVCQISMQHMEPAPGSQPATPESNCRYDAEFWSKVSKGIGGRKGKVRDETGSAGGQLRPQESQWDLAACRALLLQLDNEDLRQRLSESLWRQAKAKSDRVSRLGPQADSEENRDTYFHFTS